MIHLLWPTVRPVKMLETHSHWIETASDARLIKTLVAVNTAEQAAQLTDFEVLVVGDEHCGAAYATAKLGQAVQGSPTDIVILVSDDMFAPANWDSWLRSQFSSWDGAIIVNDGYQGGGCVTLPIMTFSCLLKLNRFIYHPSYQHQFADAELYRNLLDLGLLRDLRKLGSPLFEHKHWACGKRGYDHVDQLANNHGGADDANFARRMQLEIQDRLK